MDSYLSATAWYQSFGFIPIGDLATGRDTQKMYLDLTTLAGAMPRQ